MKCKLKLSDYEFVVYTDGSCNNLSPFGEGGSAYLVLQGGNIVHSSSWGTLHTTNNRTEMLAIIRAVEWIPRGSVVDVRTDSQYCIYMLRSMDRPLSPDTKNLDLIKDYRRAAGGKTVHFTKVNGHSGEMYNEMCDSMADARMEELRIKHGIPLYDYTNSPKIKRKRRQPSQFCPASR